MKIPIHLHSHMQKVGRKKSLAGWSRADQLSVSRRDSARQNAMLDIGVFKHLLGKTSLSWCVAGLLSFAASQSALGGSLEQAKRIHDRLTGVPPTQETLNEMVAILDDPENGDDAGFQAAMHAIDGGDSDDFYNVTLKNWAAPWTNRDHDVFVPLNDYIATAIGFVKDERDFREVLYADVLYTANPELGLPAYSISNNVQYEQLEAGLERNGEQGFSLKDDLVAQSQSSVTGLPVEGTAGVITSRAAAKAFFIAGTNRANFRFTLVNHMCMDLEQVHDTTRIPDRIRQDVSRSPGGDARVFLNTCIGCHSGMDPMTQAFAYHDYFIEDIDNDPTGETGNILYTPDEVRPKYFVNEATFPYGFVTPDDQWANYWREGKNANIGWDTDIENGGRGTGARTMLQELAHSDAFAQCHVTRVFKTVCLRDPQDSDDRAQVASMVSEFDGNGRNLKATFARSADYCKGN